MIRDEYRVGEWDTISRLWEVSRHHFAGICSAGIASKRQVGDGGHARHCHKGVLS